MGTSHSIGAICEIEIRSGQPCGITAIRRCATCQRAFCLTHQAKNSFYSLDQCLPCQQKEEDQRKAAEAAEQVAREFFESGAARDALIASNVQPYEITRHTLRHQRTLASVIFDAKPHVVESFEPVGYAWILGEGLWHWSEDHGDLREHGSSSWLVALPDASTRARLIGPLANWTLVPASSRSQGYTLVNSILWFDAHSCQVQGPQDVRLDTWFPFMESVKRLAGISC